MGRNMEKINEFKKLLGKASYFNAAEGSWTAEGKARNENREKLHKIALELHGDGIDLDYIVRNGQYLVSDTDYKPQEIRG